MRNRRSVAMETPSVLQLCKQLISLAVQRCRLSTDLCRLSVEIRRSQSSDPRMIQISALNSLIVTSYCVEPVRICKFPVSDTGSGSTLEEFRDLKYSFHGISDGVLTVITTSITDDEICHYKLNLSETYSSRRVTRLPSTSKNSAIFSGTEVSLSAIQNIDVFVTDLACFFRKMLILKPHNIAVELIAEVGDHPRSLENIIMANGNMSLPLTPSSSVELLKAQLEEYVYKHGYYSSEKCQNCFPNSEHLKVGNGVAFSENRNNSQLIVEAVIIISETSEQSSCSCYRPQNSTTEVLYFKEYGPCSIHPSLLNTLKSISWNAYGLKLASITCQDGVALLEWENLPINVHIHIALHCYNKQLIVSPLRKIARVEGKLIKKSAIAALNDLKEKYSGSLLSAHAIKICDYAPDLARSIAGLILSSEDHDFQAECLSMLGLDIGSDGADLVENCIKEKIISTIEKNDRKNSRSSDPAPFLFEPSSHLQEPNYMDDEYEEGDEPGFSFMND